MSYAISADIGGTFTDIALLDRATQRLHLGKTLSTPDDPSRGVLHGIRSLLSSQGIEAAQIERFIHATTLVSNAIVERKGARTGLITTVGCRDILEIARCKRYNIFDIFAEFPTPLVPRWMREEVDERMSASGEVLTPLDEQGLLDAASSLVEKGAQSLAICFLHAYANPSHEMEAKRLLENRHPGVAISVSHEVARETREYERSTTTAANAYVKPAIDAYLGRLVDGANELGINGPLQLMSSLGGIASVSTARALPVHFVESGPAGGALAAGFFGTLAGAREVLAFDMGGTTAKACLVAEGNPMIAHELEVARLKRFQRGSGLPLKVPSVDLIEIGAGGGSAAYVDELGLLRVGPRSTGSDPGPACYGRGGDEPTVTDADLVLGYLNANYFLGGEMPLKREAAEAAIRDKICPKLNLPVAEIAEGIIEIVTENMASAIRVYLSEHGRNPSEMTMVATGGAGPVHADRLARKLRCRKVLAPLGSGVGSAIGLLIAAPRVELVRGYTVLVDALDLDAMNAIVASMRDEADGMLASAGASPERVEHQLVVDARFLGQGFEISVLLPEGIPAVKSASTIVSAFLDAYKRAYGRAPTNTGIELTALRLRSTERASVPDGLSLQVNDHDGRDQRQKGTRQVYMAATRSYEDVPVFDRYALKAGDTFAGPAIFEERESTVVAGPGATCTVDDQGTLIMQFHHE